MIGERLTELRKDIGMTQDELAEKLLISKFTVSSYENNKTTPDDNLKVKIAKIFNVSIDYLLGLVDEPIPYQDNETVIRISPKLPKQARAEIKEFIKYIKTRY